MTKDELKDNVVRTIFYLNSDISVKDKELLIKLLNSIVDYTNGENNNQSSYKPVMIDITKIVIDNEEYIVIPNEQFKSIINSKQCIVYTNDIIEEDNVTQYVPAYITIYKNKKEITLVADSIVLTIEYIDNEYRLSNVR